MSDRVTKQGLKDLNPRAYNGRKHKHSDPVECQHNWSEVARGLASNGQKCLWCSETR